MANLPGDANRSYRTISALVIHALRFSPTKAYTIRFFTARASALHIAPRFNTAHCTIDLSMHAAVALHVFAC